MAYFIGPLIGGLMLISVTTPALADKNIFCQSELLKKNMRDSWASAIFYSSDSFSIKIESKTDAVLLDPSIGKVKCSVTETQIVCSKQERGSAMAWSVNRLTGVYESFLKSAPGDEGSKTRGICSLLSQRKF
jgi:hypothetical protein